jgi:RNA polymerase sigma factor (sigma-70 family)
MSMDANKWLADQFEGQRGHLRSVAYRMLGSLTEADDAVQEAWLRLSRADAGEIENLGGWLTTVVGRVCLDMLRSRKARREDALMEELTVPVEVRADRRDPEQEALLADSVGLALLVVLDRLTPAERLAFVMHDMFAIPFDEIAPVVNRSAEATRQLASRARHRVQGTEGVASGRELHRNREVVDNFLSALRAGDFEGLLAVLDPNVVVRIDEFSAAGGEAIEIRGAANWAKSALTYSRGARFSQPALVDGEVGVIVAPMGKLFRVLRLKMKEGKIAEIEVTGDMEKFGKIDLAILQN